jgi:F-type H+-transporting ATPase subunit b
MEGNPLTQVDPGLYIWAISVFLVLAWLLAKFAWRPLLVALAARQESIRQSLADADRAKQELARLQTESAKILAEARKEADQIISRTRADATRVGEEMKVKARADAENIVKNAERQISLETSRAVEKIRHEAIDLSVAIASKLLRRNLTREDNERLIAETFKEIEGTQRPN